MYVMNALKVRALQRPNLPETMGSQNLKIIYRKVNAGGLQTAGHKD
jgi:hypothetical protein